MHLTDVIFIEDLVVFIFRIINFVILLGLLAYGFKRYCLPSLQEAYQAYHGYFDYLASSHDRLLNESRDIDAIQEKERHEYDLLKDRIMQWKIAVDGRNERIIQKRERQHLECNDRLATQQEKIRQYQLKAQVIPLAVADARKRLIELAKANQFQHAIIQKTKTLLRKVHQ